MIVCMVTFIPSFFFFFRYLRDKDKTFEMTSNMKRLLSTHLKNLPLKNKLCVQLGFKDLSASNMLDETLLNDLARL